MIETLIVLGPAAGGLASRLAPPLSPADAADLGAAALTDTLDAVARTPAQRRMFVHDGADYPLKGWLRRIGTDGIESTDGTDGSYGGADRRIAAAFAAGGRGPSVLVGSETPQLRPSHLAGFDPQAFDACLGPASDGAYWAIGLRDPSLAGAAIHGVPMSTDRTAREQLRRLTAIGLRVQLLDELVRVDTIDSAELVADIAPATAFATTFAQVRASAARQIAWAG